MMGFANRLQSVNDPTAASVCDEIVHSTNKVFEACAFQDLTGQHINRLVRMWGKEELARHGPTASCWLSFALKGRSRTPRGVLSGNSVDGARGPFAPPAGLPRAALRRLTAAPKTSFREPLQAHPSIQPVSEKYSSFFLSEIMIDCRRPVSHEGRFAIVTDVEAGCGGRVDVAAWLIPRRRTTLMRTVKSRGPGIPMLMPR